MRSWLSSIINDRLVRATRFLLVMLILASAPALGQTSSLGTVIPNPAQSGEPIRFTFYAGVPDCEYDFVLRTVGQAGNVVLVTFDLVPRPPGFICFSAAPPLGGDADLGVLPPDNYVARAQGFLNAVALPPVEVPFRVLGVASASVPVMSHWAQALLTLIVLAIAFDVLRRGRSA